MLSHLRKFQRTVILNINFLSEYWSMCVTGIGCLRHPEISEHPFNHVMATTATRRLLVHCICLQLVCLHCMIPALRESPKSTPKSLNIYECMTSLLNMVASLFCQMDWADGFQWSAASVCDIMNKWAVHVKFIQHTLHKSAALQHTMAPSAILSSQKKGCEINLFSTIRIVFKMVWR